MKQPPQEYSTHERLRSIPSVERILESRQVKELLQRYSRTVVLKSIQKKLEKMRRELLRVREPAAGGTPLSVEAIACALEEEIISCATPHLEKVINATGVILHTNLGRSLLPEESMAHLKDIALAYSNLEYDLEEGRRGSRYSHVEGLFGELTGAEAAFVVNNNAAAVLLALNTLASGREVLVSRGELIEIGGSFRIPDIMKRSGALMVEVGTTNKTHLSDYEEAITDATALLLKVHTSNYRIVGFTAEVDLTRLIELGKRYHLPVVNDLGSGSLIDFSRYGLTHEPTVQEVVETGVDVITFSGDKLLGGPQAGVIVGRKQILEKLKKNPLNRALRIDKLTLAVLETTLRLYRDPETVSGKIPTLRMITLPLESIEKRASELTRNLQISLPDHIEVQLVDDFSQVGGGALPSQQLPTKVIALRSTKVGVQELEQRLRKVTPPIIARINKDQVRIDLRTVSEQDDRVIEDSLKEIVSG